MEEFFFFGNSLKSSNLKEAGSGFLMSLLGRLPLGLVTYLLLFAYRMEVTILLALNESSLRYLLLSVMLIFFCGI